MCLRVVIEPILTGSGWRRRFISLHDPLAVLYGVAGHRPRLIALVATAACENDVRSFGLKLIRRVPGRAPQVQAFYSWIQFRHLIPPRLMMVVGQLCYTIPEDRQLR